MDPAISLDHVTIRLARRTILNDITLAIDSRAFVAVLGPNGAGKTTLLRAILGLVPISQGSLKILGAPPRRGNPAIGYMPQTRQAAPPSLTGHDFVAAAANGHRWGLAHPNAADRRDVDRVLSLVDATALARRPLPDLSGGERQRLLLAQSLLGAPRLLLLDEPLISLDIPHQHAVIDLVRHLQQELGIAVLFSAHDINPLLGALDQVLYLANTHAAIGPPEAVITSATLSKLYDVPIDVLTIQGRIFVMSGASPVDHAHHHH
jgi:zinc/manganese transport system ATP-binding protein